MALQVTTGRNGVVAAFNIPKAQINIIAPPEMAQRGEKALKSVTANDMSSRRRLIGLYEMSARGGGKNGKKALVLSGLG